MLLSYPDADFDPDQLTPRYRRTNPMTKPSRNPMTKPPQEDAALRVRPLLERYEMKSLIRALDNGRLW